MRWTTFDSSNKINFPFFSCSATRSAPGVPFGPRPHRKTPRMMPICAADSDDLGRRWATDSATVSPSAVAPRPAPVLSAAPRHPRAGPGCGGRCRVEYSTHCGVFAVKNPFRAALVRLPVWRDQRHFGPGRWCGAHRDGPAQCRRIDRVAVCRTSARSSEAAARIGDDWGSVRRRHGPGVYGRSNGEGNFDEIRGF